MNSYRSPLPGERESEMNKNSNALVIGSLAQVANQQNVSLAESFLFVDAILLVDMSGSMSSHDAPGGLSRFEAAENELKKLQEALPGKVAVVAFSDQAVFCPTGIPIRLCETTNMAAALRFVQPADGVARIILISDGEPNSEAETLQVARTFKSKIDTVYIGPERGHGRHFLQQLAQACGGIFSQGVAPGMLAENVTRLLEATA